MKIGNLELTDRYIIYYTHKLYNLLRHLAIAFMIRKG
jgi:hypothetical protein